MRFSLVCFTMALWENVTMHIVDKCTSLFHYHDNDNEKLFKKTKHSIKLMRLSLEIFTMAMLD